MIYRKIAGNDGYYLIGLNRGGFTPELLSGIQGGAERVLKQTVDIVKKHRQEIRPLPRWGDIDTLEYPR
jgi:glycosyltransferase A (GT-A) superfamily protein (DUF2064 family)